MKVVITYGTYDLMHYGHIRLLERAKALGDYLIVGVTSDAYDKQRGKLNVQQTLAERMEAVRQTGLANLIIAEEYEGQKIEDIQKYNVDIFTVGSDWKGQFNYLNNYCQVVYLERTKGISSTEIRECRYAIVKLGCIGMDNPTERLLEEIKYVSGVEVTACFCENKSDTIIQNIVADYDINICQNINDFFQKIDAVYIATSIENNFKYIKAALEMNKHILCETPISFNFKEAEQLYTLAEQNNLVFMEAIKTLYFPAFEHLVLLIGSRIIGDIVHIEVSCSQSNPQLDIHDKYQGSLYDFGTYILLPIFKFLGTSYLNCEMKNIYNEEKEFCKFTSGYIEYDNAVAIFKAGKGIKTENEMIITGSEGYIYIPAPWWKPDYFEVRYEDLRNTRKYFFKYDGEGLRYEIGAFIKQINNPTSSLKWGKIESLAVTKIMELFNSYEE